MFARTSANLVPDDALLLDASEVEFVGRPEKHNGKQETVAGPQIYARQVNASAADLQGIRDEDVARELGAFGGDISPQDLARINAAATPLRPPQDQNGLPSLPPSESKKRRASVVFPAERQSKQSRTALRSYTCRLCELRVERNTTDLTSKAMNRHSVDCLSQLLRLPAEQRAHSGTATRQDGKVLLAFSLMQLDVNVKLSEQKARWKSSNHSFSFPVKRGRDCGLLRLTGSFKGTIAAETFVDELVTVLLGQLDSEHVAREIFSGLSTEPATWRIEAQLTTPDSHKAKPFFEVRFVRKDRDAAAPLTLAATLSS